MFASLPIRDQLPALLVCYRFLSSLVLLWDASRLRIRVSFIAIT